MAEKLGLGNEVRQLKIGQSFTNPKSSSFHSIKYDFKPASVDTNKMATVDVGSNHQVTVTVPHLDGAGVPQTVFKGSQRPYQKECVLIIDRVTGEITLEKLACNIQVKKTRSESAKLPLPHDRLSQNNGRSQTPPTVGHRVSHRTKVTSGSRRPDRPITHLVPKHSPLGASPNYPSPVHHKSPKNNTNESHNSNQGNSSTLASLPMIGGMDDFPDPPVAHVQASVSLPSLGNNSHGTSSSQNHNGNNIMNSNHGSGSNNMNNSNHNNDKSSPTSAVFPPLRNQNNDHPGAVVGEITDSSSSSSGDSDSDTDDPDKTVIHKVLPTAASMSSYAKTNGHHSLTNGVVPPPQHQSPVNKLPTHLLNEDLCLSESGSDSD